MSTLVPSRPEPLLAPTTTSRSIPARKWHLPVLLLFWLAVFATSLATPPLLDDADATHAQAAQAMLRTGDWVTLHVDGVRYLEKAPLPYWIAALSLRLFGENAFAIHLPLALAVLGLAALGYFWALRSFDSHTAFYAALFTLTCTGVFLFTRIFIPDALLSLFLACGLYSFQRALEPASIFGARHLPKDCHPERSEGPAFYPQQPSAAPARSRSSGLYALLFWLAMALAVLTKGLIAIVFLLGTAALYLTLTRTWFRWRILRPISGSLLFLAVAAPWHILAGVRNTHGAGGHGFFWFYFVNEHFLRFLGRRTPRDYNRLPGSLYWALQTVWLFPWSFFLPVALLTLWRRFRAQTSSLNRDSNLLPPLPMQLGLSALIVLCLLAGAGITTGVLFYLAAFGGLLVISHRLAEGLPWTPFEDLDAPGRAQLLLCLFFALVLGFFSLSTNQEYYTFPVYLPLLLLLAAGLAHAESSGTAAARRAVLGGQAALAVFGTIVAAALLSGLWSSRHIAGSTGIGDLLAHRGVGDYTLSMSHLFDLTGPSFAALRLPAGLAAGALGLGTGTAWWLRRRERHFASTFTLALTSAVFLIAAHLALVRFTPLLSSQDFAAQVAALHANGSIAPTTQVLLLGDQAFGSSIPFYLQQQVKLVDGRSTSMLFGSTFPDVPPLFVSSRDLAAEWGHGPRKLLFVPAEQREAAERLLGTQTILLFQSSGKELLTDRPLIHEASAVKFTAAPPLHIPVISTGAAKPRSGETPVFAPAHAR